MRPSSSCSTRLLNAVSKPRTLMPTDMIPVWTKSTPFTNLRAAPNELPTEFSISWTSSRVTVAGASVTFSVRRDAETTHVGDLDWRASEDDDGEFGLFIRPHVYAGHGDRALTDALGSNFVRAW